MEIALGTILDYYCSFPKEYLPTNRDRRESTLERKRKEYCDCITRYFDVNDSERTVEEKGLFRQAGFHFDVTYCRSK